MIFKALISSNNINMGPNNFKLKQEAAYVQQHLCAVYVVFVNVQRHYRSCLQHLNLSQSPWNRSAPERVSQVVKKFLYFS